MPRHFSFRRSLVRVVIAVFVGALVMPAGLAKAEIPPGQSRPKPAPADVLSSGGMAALFPNPTGNDEDGEDRNEEENHGDRLNAFVNDPCLDPAHPNIRRTVQSETDIAVLNSKDSSGQKMVVGYNDSFGFYDNRQGLSGFSYSTNGGRTWIDGGGLPPKVPSGAPSSAAGSDHYFGDPVVVVHHASETFYYASIYQNAAGVFTVSVNRGWFQEAPAQGTESVANTRCAGNPALNGIPQAPEQEERIIWEPPVEAVKAPFLGPTNNDFLDKEWLYVDQTTGTLYLSYTRFADDGGTPIELVRSFDGGRTWTAPSVIVPNLDFEFNQATQPITTTTGRVIVTWHNRVFAETSPFAELFQRIQVAVSDDNGATFGAAINVATVNPQREPPGYNRQRRTILNAPYITVNKGADDGVVTQGEAKRPGFGDVYIAYFSGKTGFPVASAARSQADTFVSRSSTNGSTWAAQVKVNDDPGNTTHVFPSVQVTKNGNVHVAWIDRRLDQTNNILNDTWAARSTDRGQSFRPNTRVSNVSTSWFTRADARPNMGDYNSSELINFETFVTVWADGRFPPPPTATCVAATPTLACPTGRPQSTPDVIFAIVDDD